MGGGGGGGIGRLSDSKECEQCKWMQGRPYDSISRKGIIQYRVLEFLSRRAELYPHLVPPQASVSPPRTNVGGGGDTLACGGGGDPIQTTGQKLWYSIE
jgi:hypothetical protein